MLSLGEMLLWAKYRVILQLIDAASSGMGKPLTEGIFDHPE
jgi:hypothetical protein